MEPLFATNFAHQNRYPSTSVESADFAEIPLLHNFKNRIGSFKTKEMHKSVFVESNENVAVNKVFFEGKILGYFWRGLIF